MRDLQTAVIRFYNEIRTCQLTEAGGSSTMGLLIGAGILSICVVAAWMMLRRPLRQIVEDVHVDHARALFHQHREWLEARFISSLSQVEPADWQRWEAAHWHDEVIWARDRQTRHLLALVCVHFDAGPFDEWQGRRHATAVFEFRKGQWCVDGRCLDKTRPDEAVGRNQPFEPVVVPQPNPRRVG
jgi:hypothetical protein